MRLKVIFEPEILQEVIKWEKLESKCRGTKSRRFVRNIRY